MKGHHNDQVADARDGIRLLGEPLDELLVGLIFYLLDLIEVPFDFRLHEGPLEVIYEFAAKIFPRLDRVL